MLTIKCSGCKRKLFKYRKIGPGKVLRCHKARIVKKIDIVEQVDSLVCPCGQVVGLDMGRFFKMNADMFIHTGTKDTA